MTRYHAPKLCGQKVLWKGRRYWVIEVTPELPFDFVDASLGDMVLYDGLNEAVIATARAMPNGTYLCSLAFSHVEIHCHAKSIRDIANAVPPVADSYCKACGG